MQVGDRPAGEPQQHVTGAAGDHDDARIEGAAGEPGLRDPGLDLNALRTQRIDQPSNRGRIAIDAQLPRRIQPRRAADLRHLERRVRLHAARRQLERHHARGGGTVPRLQKDAAHPRGVQRSHQFVVGIGRRQRPRHRHAGGGEPGVAFRLVEHQRNLRRRVQETRSGPNALDFNEQVAPAQEPLPRREHEAGVAFQRGHRGRRDVGRVRLGGEASPACEQGTLDREITSGRFQPDVPLREPLRPPGARRENFRVR